MPKVYNKYHKDAPPGTVYVGRPSKWGNPYPVGSDFNREEAILAFTDYISTPERIALVKKELKGKDLVCYCAPKPCHADVLLRIAND